MEVARTKINDRLCVVTDCGFAGCETRVVVDSGWTAMWESKYAETREQAVVNHMGMVARLAQNPNSIEEEMTNMLKATTALRWQP